MHSAADFFAWLNSAAGFAEAHPTITIAVLILLLTFGTPEIGPADKPWIKTRSGLGWIALKMVSAYADRTQVFRGIEDEVKAFREQSASTEKRVGAMERVVDWQTQVLVAIASVLKVDPLSLLRKTEVNQAGVAAVSRESVPDVGKKGEKSVEAPTVTG